MSALGRGGRSLPRSLAAARLRLGAGALGFALAWALALPGTFLYPAPADALDANGQLEDHGLQTRFEIITHKLRCLVCQNESIADSNVELARDLRRQVQEMLVAGRSDDEIFRYMTDRYGEFVRFSPPLEPKTFLIWGAPFIALLLGAVIIFRVVRQRSRMPLDDEPSEPQSNP